MRCRAGQIQTAISGMFRLALAWRPIREPHQGDPMRLYRTALPVVGVCLLFLSAAPGAQDDRPVAEIFGQKVFAAELAASGMPAQDAARRPGETLRARVWTAVFEDYARRRNIVASEAEVDAQIAGQRRMQAHGDAERARQRAALVTELQSPTLSDRRRREAQQQLDLLNRLAEFDVQRERELRDPAMRALRQQSERRVARHWVRQWKLNQALHREFGGRIIFQQAGWEPIDAYRKLLDQYEARKAFVVYDPVLRAVVYDYFEKKFVYADDARAQFYFDKPYWERTPEEMRAAGF